jgi:hypothetical protein
VLLSRVPQRESEGCLEVVRELDVETAAPLAIVADYSSV